jgi:hypothetical protein
MKKACPICGQKMDIWTSSHKNAPFVDGKNYPAICFTCYFVPKTSEQTYNKDGSVAEDIELPYSCQNLCSSKELQLSGAAETARQAKASAEAVANACKGVRPPKSPLKRPVATWNVG